MQNLKKAAFNITSKFGLLQAHRSLVLTISEERQVYDTVLKLILARVNASTSLLKWVKKENNESLQENIKLLYDINMVWTNVQKEFAEQTNEFSTSLKEILQVEIGIDAIKKELKNAIEKKDKIQKQLADNAKKKAEQVGSLEVDLAKAIDEEETLQIELEVKSLKAEIYKAKAMKTSLLKNVKSHLQLAERIKEIFSTAEVIIQSIPDVSSPIREDAPLPISLAEKTSLVKDLSSKLNIQKPISDMVFHIDLPNSSTLSKTPLSKSPTSPGEYKNKLLGLKKQTSKTDMEYSPKPDWEYNDFVFVTNIPPPKTMPPPVPEYRPRSKTNITPTRTKGLVRQNQIRKKKYSTPDYGHYASVEDSDYVEPNLNGALNPSHRSSSDSELSKSDYGYCPPWENLMPSWSTHDLLEGKTSKHASLPHHFYDEPFGDKNKVTKTQSTFVYDEPYQISEDTYYHRFLDQDESYTDISDETSEESDSCNFENNNNIIQKSSTENLTKQPPVPVPRQRKQSEPVLCLSEKLKKPRPSLPLLPPAKQTLNKNIPLPKPRPKTCVMNDSPPKESSMFYVGSDKQMNKKNNSPPRFSPLSPVDAKNIKDIVLELKDKLQPIGASIKK